MRFIDLPSVGETAEHTLIVTGKKKPRLHNIVEDDVLKPIWPEPVPSDGKPGKTLDELLLTVNEFRKAMDKEVKDLLNCAG